MISQIKGLIESQKNIEELHSKLVEHTDSFSKQGEIVKELHNEISNLKTNFENVNMGNQGYIDNLKKDINEISILKQHMNDELNDLKLLKTQIKQKLVEELVGEFKTELRANTDRIKTDIKSYNDLKQNLASISSQLDAVKGEMEKFNNISKHIKETDFTLVKHAKKLEDVNDEKLRLLKEVDSLQKMLGRERRKR